MRRSVVVLIVALLVIGALGVAQAADLVPYDFKGKTVYQVDWFNSGVPGRFKEGGVAEGRLQDAERLFNCKIEFISPAANDGIVDAYVARYLSGDSVRDFWQVQPTTGIYELASEGMLMPLNQHYASIDGFKLSPVVETFSYHGDVFVIQIYSDDEEFDLPAFDCDFFMVAWNKELFERGGLPNPYDLYEAGEWTWDVVTDLAKRATKDTNGDGTIDQWGIDTIWNWNWDLFIATNGGNITEEQDGKVVYTLDEPAAVNAVKQIVQWSLQDKVMDNSYGNAFQEGRAAMAFRPLWTLRSVKEQMSQEYGVVPAPKGPDAYEHKFPVSSRNLWVMPSNVEDPEAMMALWKFLYADDDATREMEGQASNREWIEATMWDRESVDYAFQAVDSWKGEMWLHQFRTVRDRLMGEFWNLSIGAANINRLSEIKPEIQAMIDDVLGQ